MPPQGTVEVDLRRGSTQDLLEKLERTTGMRFNVRRARVTSRRSQWVLEVAAPDRRESRSAAL